MRKIIVYIATSADGYIARPDGGVEWLDRPQTAGDYGMGAFYRTIDTILWGRKTYDFGVAHGVFDENVQNFVFSRQPLRSLAPGVELVDEPIGAFARRIRALPGKNIWMMGAPASSARSWMNARSMSSSSTSYRF